MRACAWASLVAAAGFALAASCGGKAIIDLGLGGAGGAVGAGGASKSSSSSATNVGVTTGPGSQVAVSGAGGGTTIKPCKSDKDCAFGAEWCIGGTCSKCDNGGLACDLACQNGWQMYVRNGCHPCACAPVNACASDKDCQGQGGHCYAGQFCADWCPKGDPSCCFGNQCEAPGCPDPDPIGCVKSGCPNGFHCSAMSCGSSSCKCAGGSWSCTKDCAGGSCTPSLAM